MRELLLEMLGWLGYLGACWGAGRSGWRGASCGCGGLGRGLAEGRSERMRGLRLLWPWWTSAMVGGRMRDGGGETGE
jgi:hypothetical protein